MKAAILLFVFFVVVVPNSVSAQNVDRLVDFAAERIKNRKTQREFPKVIEIETKKEVPTGKVINSIVPELPVLKPEPTVETPEVEALVDKPIAADEELSPMAPFVDAPRTDPPAEEQYESPSVDSSRKRMWGDVELQESISRALANYEVVVPVERREPQIHARNVYCERCKRVHTFYFDDESVKRLQYNADIGGFVWKY